MSATVIQNIFLAEDDSEDIYLFQSALKAVNAKVMLHTAENGAEMLEMLKSGHLSPDLVILDINMPVKNGFTCLEVIRASERLKNLPVAILSTSSDKSTIKRAFDSRANAYITKPSAYGDLKKMINRCLQLNWVGISPLPIDKFVLSN